MKKLLEEHFEFLSKMSVKEYTLYRTWKQIQTEKWTKQKLQRAWEIRHSMWVPEKPEDYLNLEPIVITPKNTDQNLTWKMLRYFVSTAPTFSIPGRSMRAYVVDKITKKFLGVLQLASDFPSMKSRDEYIGWNMEHKMKGKDKRLNYLAMAPTIVPTQPLGFSYMGGKLMSLLLSSDVIEKEWNSKYKEPLVAITTTSLYGSFSQYNRLKYWRKCGKTTGKISLEPDNEMNLKLRHWCRENYPEDLTNMENKSHPKTRVLNFCYKKFGVKPPENNAPRGVYFCELFDNVKSFLRKETDNFGERKFDNSVEVLVNLWKEKYAKKRLKNLMNTDRYSNKTFFYDDMINMDWEQTKEKYLSGI